MYSSVIRLACIKVYPPLALDKPGGIRRAYYVRWHEVQVPCADLALIGLGVSHRQDQLAPHPFEFGAHDAITNSGGKPGPVDIGNETGGEMEVRQPVRTRSIIQAVLDPKGDPRCVVKGAPTRLEPQALRRGTEAAMP